MQINKRVMVPLSLLIGLQILDVAVHIAAQQIEPIRVMSNIILTVGGLMVLLFSVSVSRFAIAFAIAAYLALNLFFVLAHGFINPATETLRIPLLVFVLGSLGFSQWLWRCIR